MTIATSHLVRVLEARFHPFEQGVERVLVVAANWERLRALADELWAAGCIAYCAGSSTEAVELVVAGLRPRSVLVDPALGATAIKDLRERLSAAMPGVGLEVRAAPLREPGR